MNYQRPVDGRLASEYGDSRPGGVIHAGWDLAAAAGAAVRAPTDGIVVAVEKENRAPFRGYGPATIVLQGVDGLYHLLGHLATSPLPPDPRIERFSPGVGAMVRAGQKLGELAAIRGPHVHWEVRTHFIAPHRELRPHTFTIPPGLWLGVHSTPSTERKAKRNGGSGWLLAAAILYWLNSRS